MMKVENYIPSVPLKPYIRSYTVIAASHDTETLVLPHSGLVLAVPFKGHIDSAKEDSVCHIASATLSGMRKTFRRFRYGKEAENILISFTETGAAAFFKEPLHELFESLNPLSDLFKPSETAFFEEQVAAAKNNRGRINIVERFLLNKLIRPGQDNMIVNAIREIYTHNGALNIHSLPGKFSISQDAFEKRFRKAAGATPKQFSSIIRMKSVVLQGRQNRSFTQLGYDFGYYDQSHFIKEFRSFTGQSPKEFFKTPYHW